MTTPSAARDVAARAALAQRATSWVRSFIEPLTDEPNQLSVRSVWNTESVLLLLVETPNEQDRARLVGRGGWSVNALRRFASTLGVRVGVRVNLEVGDGDGRGAPGSAAAR